MATGSVLLMDAKYQRIVDAIRYGIASGVLPDGEQLSSQREMMDEFAVSRITVVRAMAELRRLGLIVTEQGRGTFVRNPNKDQKREMVHGFAALLREAEIAHAVENDVLDGPLISIPFADNEEIIVLAHDTYALYAEWVAWKQPAGEDVANSEKFLNASDDPDVMLGAVQAAIAKRERELDAENALFAHQDEEAARYESTREESTNG
jgi:DNA-binding transcriptional regulator YhcF (GntR family)